VALAVRAGLADRTAALPAVRLSAVSNSSAVQTSANPIQRLTGISS
jgi:hypothetical protein